MAAKKKTSTRKPVPIATGKAKSAAGARNALTGPYSNEAISKRATSKEIAGSNKAWDKAVGSYPGMSMQKNIGGQSGTGGYASTSGRTEEKAFAAGNRAQNAYLRKKVMGRTPTSNVTKKAATKKKK